MEDDLSVIEAIPAETRVVYSVPNFDDTAHVRFFDGVLDVYDRYELVDVYDTQIVEYKNGKASFVVSGIRA